MLVNWIIVAVIVIAWFVGIIAEFESIWSPVGMLVATIGCTLLISPAFQDVECAGWLMVFFSIFYLVMTVRAFQLYFRLNRKD